ncbi:MAG: sulfatase-like hydrolase/transferase, partial [Bacteroidota bacterium]
EKYENIQVKEKEVFNVLWIVAEDLSPDLSCYNNIPIATKNIDKIAREGMVFTNAYSTSPYGYPSRAAIFTGTFPHTMGLQHVNNGRVEPRIIPPAEIKIFTEYLRANGYYCSLSGNIDVPFEDASTTWDYIASSKENNQYRHIWENRPEDKPFFSTIYLSHTQEKYNLPASAMKKAFATDSPELSAKNIESITDSIINSDVYKNVKIDLKKIKLPDYLPNNNRVKEDYARMYLNIKRLDNEVGNILQQLENDKLEKNTIVFFFSENGRGLPGGKRWLYEGGIQVPLIIKMPGVTYGGEKNDQLVSLVDLAPTLLVNLGIRIPDYMQGLVFLGKLKNEPREFIFAARDRIGEANEKLRCIRSDKFKYIRNFTQEIPFEEPIEILEFFPTTSVMKRIAKTQDIDENLEKFISKKREEELYDLRNDPNELYNLVERDYFIEDLNLMRKAYEKWEQNIGGFINISESEMLKAMTPDEGYELITEVPEFSKEGGKLTSPTSLDISCPTAGASIAYAILPDGAYTILPNGQPDIQWQIYTQPVTIDQNCTILSKAVRYGFEESPIKSVSFSLVAEAKL